MDAYHLPPILIAAFDGDAALLRWTRALPPSAQRDLSRWVLDPKSEEARLRRADQLAERLLATMEAERELPPLIALALKRTPGAEAGWKALTPTQRRALLLRLFGARTLETQQRHLQRLVDQSVGRDSEPEP